MDRFLVSVSVLLSSTLNWGLAALSKSVPTSVAQSLAETAYIAQTYRRFGATPMRITSDTRAEINPSVVQCANGDILIAYQVWDSIEPDPGRLRWVMLRRSTDNGNTWLGPDSLYWGAYCDPRLARTADGRIWLFLGEQSIKELLFSTSSDNGHHWSSLRVFPSAETCLSSGVLLQTRTGRLLIFYIAPESGGAQVFCQHSDNNGATWSEWRRVTDTYIASSYFGASVQDTTNCIWLIVASFYYTSTDNGETWSSRRILRWVYLHPRACVEPVGTIWVGSTRGSDVHTIKTTDNGTTWNHGPSTRYLRSDTLCDLTPVNGRAYLVFSSNRWSNWDIYGCDLETMNDTAAPPIFYWAECRGKPILRHTFAPNCYVDDELGFQSVILRYRLEGVLQADLELFDDGQHGDGDSGDLFFGNYLGPLQSDHALSLSGQFHITDLTGNTIIAPPDSFRLTILGCHDTNNLWMVLNHRTGMDGAGGGPYPSCEWPAHSDTNYLFSGGIWVGTIVAGETLVSDLNPNNGQCDWSVCEAETLRWQSGIADLESRVRLDDRNPYSDRPIGIEIVKHTYSWHNWRYDDFIIEKLVFRNIGRNGDLHNLYIGYMYDFDVWQSNSNFAACDTQRGLSYMFNYGGIPSGYIGLLMLSHRPRCHLHWRIENDPRSPAEMYQWLAADSFMQPSQTWGDYRILQSVGPFDLAVGETLLMVGAIVAGPGLSGLQENADSARSVYEHGLNVGCSEIKPQPLSLGLHPITTNPVTGTVRLRYLLPVETRVELVVYDVAGRVVQVLADGIRKAGIYDVHWSGEPGIYFCQLRADGNSVAEKLIVVH